MGSPPSPVCDSWSFLGYWGGGEFTAGCRPHEHGTHEHPAAKRPLFYSFDCPSKVTRSSYPPRSTLPLTLTPTL